MRVPDDARKGPMAQGLRLLVLLAASTQGLTHAEMAEELEVSKKTAERMRAALDGVVALEIVQDGTTRRYRLEGRMDPRLLAPTAAELADLALAATEATRRGNAAMADRLTTLHDRILAATTNRGRLEPDLEALAQARLPIVPAGPAIPAPREVEEACTLAFLSGRTLAFDYAAADGPTRHEVAPRGLLVGARSYLVGAMNDWGNPSLFRLDRMSGATVTDTPAWEDEDFDLSAFAARSFGIYQERPEDIVLRFDAAVADDARASRFHPSQVVEDLPDGRVEVRFRAGGVLELARHLFGWGGTVEIVGPERLRRCLADQIAEVQARLAETREGPAGPGQRGEPTG